MTERQGTLGFLMTKKNLIGWLIKLFVHTEMVILCIIFGDVHLFIVDYLIPLKPCINDVFETK